MSSPAWLIDSTNPVFQALEDIQPQGNDEQDIIGVDSKRRVPNSTQSSSNQSDSNSPLEGRSSCPDESTSCACHLVSLQVKSGHLGAICATRQIAEEADNTSITLQEEKTTDCVQDEEEEQSEQQQSEQQARTTEGKKRAIFGRMFDILSRTWPTSKVSTPSTTGVGRSWSLRALNPDVGAAPSSSQEEAAWPMRSDSDHGINVENPMRTEHAASQSPSSISECRMGAVTEAAAAGNGEEDGGSEGYGGGLLSDRMGREEKFHSVIMENKIVRTAFTLFCKNTFSWENVEFVRQVREADRLSTAEGTTAAELQAKLLGIATKFIIPGGPTEVNVRGSGRDEVLCSIKAALDAADCDQVGWGGKNGPWTWALTIDATKALVALASEVHAIIFDGIWPRFLISDEFTTMMDTPEMRTTGFMDFNGKLIVGALASQDSERGKRFAGRSFLTRRRSLSSKLMSPFLLPRLTESSGGVRRADETTSETPRSRGKAGSDPRRPGPLKLLTTPAGGRSNKKGSVYLGSGGTNPSSRTSQLSSAGSDWSVS